MEASRQNIEDSPNTQDQDIVQEQIQERMEPENEINICKFYIKKCCKHGLRVTTAIIHTLLHAKNKLKTLYVDADQNAPINTQIFANILCNSESATT